MILGNTQEFASPEEAVKHYGVKGMRWGVRKSETSAQKMLRVGEGPQATKDAQKDAKWLKKQARGATRTDRRAQRRGTYFTSKDVAAVKKTTEKTLKPELKALNKKPEYSGRAAKKQLKDPNSALRKQYDKEQSQLFVKNLTAAAQKHKSLSPSGKWEDTLRVSKDGTWTIGIKRTDEAKHAAFDDMDLVVRVRPIRDDDGLIVDYEMLEPNELIQSAVALGSQFVLSHLAK